MQYKHNSYISLKDIFLHFILQLKDTYILEVEVYPTLFILNLTMTQYFSEKGNVVNSINFEIPFYNPELGNQF